jgi:hypothetical protein
LEIPKSMKALFFNYLITMRTITRSLISRTIGTEVVFQVMHLGMQGLEQAVQSCPTNVAKLSLSQPQPCSHINIPTPKHTSSLWASFADF